MWEDAWGVGGITRRLVVAGTQEPRGGIKGNKVRELARGQDHMRFLRLWVLGGFFLDFI